MKQDLPKMDAVSNSLLNKRQIKKKKVVRAFVQEMQLCYRKYRYIYILLRT